MANNLIATAKSLLAKNGQPVSIQAHGVAEFNPITGAPEIGTAGTVYTVNAYPSKYNASDIDGTSIFSGDIRLITSVFDVRPDRGWIVTLDGKGYSIVSVQAITQSGIDVLTINQLRAM